MRTDTNRMDGLLLFFIFCLFVYSLIAVYSGSGQYVSDNEFYFVIRQFIWYVIGFALMYVVAKMDLDILKKYSLPLYITGVFLLFLVHFFGTERNGAQRWISFGVIEIQPSEFMKLFLLIYVSVILSKLGNSQLSFKDSLPAIIRLGVVTFVPFIFIFAQPDLGSALVIVGITVSFVIVSTISFKMVSVIFAGIAGLSGGLVFLFNYFPHIFEALLKPHQLARIYGWLYPQQYATDYGYQLQQSMLGIGSGQMTGKGVSEGDQVQSGRVPEAHTDFIFTVIGEEFGFIGATILIVIYFLLLYRIVQIALETTNLVGFYISIGVIGLLGFQIFQNIGMTIGIVPITGLPLPFISYGGSALLTNFIALGLVFNVQMQSKKYMFSTNSTSI